MSYVPVNWNELPPSDFFSTPLSAENLNHMDQGIKRTHAQAMTTVQRDALTGPDLFTGRIIFNTTVERFEIYIATAPTSPAAFSTPGWFRYPTFFDVVSKTGNETINGVKTFNSPIVGTTKFMGVKLQRRDTIGIANSTLTKIPWNQTVFDTDNFHSETVNPTRVTVPVAGFYQVNINIRWIGTISSPFELFIRRNGIAGSFPGLIATNVLYPPRSPSMEATQTHTDVFSLLANDYLEFEVITRNGDADIEGNALLPTTLTIMRIGG